MYGWISFRIGLYVGLESGNQLTITVSHDRDGSQSEEHERRVVRLIHSIIISIDSYI